MLCCWVCPPRRVGAVLARAKTREDWVPPCNAQRPPWIRCEITTVEALSLLVASVCHWGQTVFAPACLAGAERLRHLEALPVRWALACS
jgi:hypothetical protein